MNPYPEDFYPNYIKYIFNNTENIEKLTKIFGKSVIPYMRCKYIEINLEKYNWWYSPDYAWLYRNSPPPISTISEINLYLRFNKIKKIKNAINRK